MSGIPQQVKAISEMSKHGQVHARAKTEKYQTEVEMRELRAWGNMKKEKFCLGNLRDARYGGEKIRSTSEFVFPKIRHGRKNISSPFSVFIFLPISTVVNKARHGGSVL